MATRSDIGTIEISGHRQKYIEIRVLQQKMSRFGITKSELEQSLRENQVFFSGINISDKQIDNLLVEQTIDNVAELEHIPVKHTDGKMVRLADICTIQEKFDRFSGVKRINGREAVNVSIVGTTAANTIQLVDEVRLFLARIPDKNVQITVLHDNTTALRVELDKIIQRTALSVALVLGFVMLLYRRFNYLLVIVLVLLINFSIGIFFYVLFDIQIHLFSLAGLTLSVGLMLDNTIIVTDNLMYNRQQQPILAVLAASLTSIASLVAVFVLDEKITYLVRDFVLIVVVNLMVSFFINLFFTPAAFALLKIKKQTKPVKTGKLTVVSEKMLFAFTKTVIGHKKWFIAAIVLFIGIPVHQLPERLDSEKSGTFGRLYNQTIGSNLYQKEIKKYVEPALGGAYRLFSLYVFEKNIYRNQHNEHVLNLMAQMPQNTGFEQLDAVTKEIENEIIRYTGNFEYFTTEISPTKRAAIRVHFSRNQLSTAFVLKNKLTRFAANMDGITWNIYGIGKQYDNFIGEPPAQYKIALWGYNYPEAKKWAETTKKILLQHPRIHEVQLRSNANKDFPVSNYNEYYVSTAMPNISEQNLLANDLKQLKANNNIPAYFSYLTERNQKLYLRYSTMETFDFWTFKQLFSSAINPTELIKTQKADDQIYKVDNNYRIILDFNYTGGIKFAQQKIDKTLDTIKTLLPTGYRIEQMEGGWYYQAKEEKQNYALVFILILSAIIFISAILFESLKLSFTAVSVIFFTIAGVFLTVYGFSVNFDIGGYAGLVFLSGIAVNAIYYIVTDFNASGGAITRSLMLYLKVIKQKSAPILLTILSTIISFWPFVLVGEKDFFWYSLSVTIIGGLIASFMALFFILPIFLFSKNDLQNQ